jgi:hypothetical protein
MKPQLFSTVLSITIVLGTFAISAILTTVAPSICWTPRIGGTLVGLAVFVQGYIFANTEKFQRKLKSGITLEQRLMHIVFTATIFGTLLWAFGDLMPKVLWVQNCPVPQ